jgi:hypothetical protein
VCSSDLGQRDMTQIFGREVVLKLAPILGFKEPLNSEKTILKVNAARFLAELAKSGYENIADIVTPAIGDPNLNDAVRLYYLRSLRNLFAVVNQDNPVKSVITKPERERAAIKALIAFLTRKPTLSANASEEEVNGYRAVRREAIRALGQSRFPVVRVDGKIETIPALHLLRFANSDKSISPPPSLSERADALTGYLQLVPDRDQNMVCASYFVAAALSNLAQECATAKPIVKGVRPMGPLGENDDYAWYLAAMRLSVSLKSWRSNWENNLPPPRPADHARMVSRVADLGDSAFLAPVLARQRANIAAKDLTDFLVAERAAVGVLLFADDKSSFIERSDSR